jgi:hypothetical protein
MWLVIQTVLVPLFAFAGFAAAFWIRPAYSLEPALIGAMTGALIGAAASMLGSLLARLSEKSEKKLARISENNEKKASKIENRVAIKAVVRSELISISGSYIRLTRVLMEALELLKEGESLSYKHNIFMYQPMPMMITWNFRAELLVLSPTEIDSIVILHHNVELTRYNIREFYSKDGVFHPKNIYSFSQEVAFDLTLLAQAFHHFYSDRKFRKIENFDDQDEQYELATDFLRGLASQLTAASELAAASDSNHEASPH